MPNESTNEERLTSSLPAPTGAYRSLSVKAPRDRSYRKSVSFNDVPIVHEVPLHDAMRYSQPDTYRSWTYATTTALPIPVTSSLYTSQLISPLNATSVTGQKIHANRLSSALYSSTHGFIGKRVPDWATKTKPSKPTQEILETYPIWNSTADEPTIKVNQQSSPPLPETNDEKKHAYRSAIVPDVEHYRTLPFTYAPVSDSSITYANVLSNPSLSEQLIISAQARARSATLPMTTTHPPVSCNDPGPVGVYRSAIPPSFANTSLSTSRAILKPATIAFQCSQANSSSPTTTTNDTSTSSSTANGTLTSNTQISRPSMAATRYGSSASLTNTHARLLSSANRLLSSTTMKYPYTHSTGDDGIGMYPPTSFKASPSSTTFSRSRSANFSSTRRHATSPVPVIDRQSAGTTSFATNKRSANLRPNYGSYYFHRLLQPANIH